MPCQPLSSVRPSAVIFLGASVAARHVELSALAAEIIAHGSDIEAQFGGILVSMLGAQAPPAAAMFYALTSASAQKAALKSVANTLFKAEPRALYLFDAVTALAKQASRTRNELAHWCWAASNDLPDRLLLIDPEALIDHDLKSGALQAPHNGRGIIYPIDLTKVHVYEKKDLVEALNLAMEISDCVSHFRFGVLRAIGDDGQERVFSHLERHPLVADILRLKEEKRAKLATS